MHVLKINKYSVLAAIIFAFFVGWWVFIAVNGLQDGPQAEVFGSCYGVMALFGGVSGLIISQRWGGFRSKIGRAVGLIALGLLAQEFGQLMYSYLGAVSEEVPYPSLGDIGYFGSVLLYIAAGLQLASAAGAKFSLKDRSKKIIAALLPLSILLASYLYFLRGYEFDFSSTTSTLAVILDFGYPLGQATYLAIALTAYFLSKKLLGGVMKPVILFILFALGVQYVSDFMFLYQNYNETWITAGSNDLVYLISYFVMTLALVAFHATAEKLRLKGVE